jgi:hypothetical protein
LPISIEIHALIRNYSKLLGHCKEFLLSKLPPNADPKTGQILRLTSLRRDYSATFLREYPDIGGENLRICEWGRKNSGINRESPHNMVTDPLTFQLPARRLMAA